MDMRKRILTKIGSWRITHWAMKKFMEVQLREADKALEVQKRFRALSAIAPDTLEYRKAYAEYGMAFMAELEKSRFYAWPPGSSQIGGLLQKIQTGTAATSEIEEFRRLAEEVMRHPRCGPAFKKCIEDALSRLG